MVKKPNRRPIRRSGRGDSVGHNAQENVNTYFDTNVSYWDDVYRNSALQGIIYQQRQSAVSAFVDAAELPRQAEVLEIGCGAGRLTVELARRGLRVQAVDASPGMVAVAASTVAQHDLEQLVSVSVADAHELPFEAGRFDLVVAVGVIPWLHSPSAAVGEMARVLGAGGLLVLSADNRLRLSNFTDPREALAQSPLKRLYWRARKRGGSMSQMHSPRAVDRMLDDNGLLKQAGRTLGFGPLSLFGRAVCDGALGARINVRLQALADRGTPGIRVMGWHYLVSARKR